MPERWVVSVVAVVVLAAGAALPAQVPDFSKVEIKSSALAPNLYLLTGAGGNIAASTGDEGVLLVDDQFAPLAGKIRVALRSAGALQPVRFIVNTHYHFDHTDGNLPWQEAGTVVIAQDNLRARLASGGLIGNGGSISREVKPVAHGALPLLTYEEQLTVHLNGEDIRVHHYPHAHTDGDSVVFFPHA
ncbi:MAG TPA: MBL fold metallo-hydrolase, partial [Steroidobacteraceae bacterium]|nr:MBL fold metallo-hydrolase [Steroidobacteraceae bacterium]